MRGIFDKGLRQQAKEQAEYERELQANPLLRYSTTQLKAELRSRKGIK